LHESVRQQQSSRKERNRSHWLSVFLKDLETGLRQSGWVEQVSLNEIAAGREICQELWPFIRELPANIVSVKNKLPAELEAAGKFLNQLADEELHYQGLYLKQCELAGLAVDDLKQSLEIPHAAERLILAMRRYCQDGTVLEGIQAVVAAELAATYFARLVLEAFEVYFARHKEKYGEENIEVGLTWLRLHAKTNMRHALWMKRMLDGVEGDADNSTKVADSEGNAESDGQAEEQSKKLPPAVEEVLNAVFELWRTPQQIIRKLDIVVNNK
jgi:hypothetical protein